MALDLTPEGEIERSNASKIPRKTLSSSRVQYSANPIKMCSISDWVRIQHQRMGWGGWRSNVAAEQTDQEGRGSRKEFLKKKPLKGWQRSFAAVRFTQLKGSPRLKYWVIQRKLSANVCACAHLYVDQQFYTKGKSDLVQKRSNHSFLPGSPVKSTHVVTRYPWMLS